MKKRSLITGANDAKAYMLMHLMGIDRDLLLADSTRQKNTIPKATGTSSYAHELLTFCLNKGIDEVVPLKEQEIVALAEAKVLFTEYDINLLIPDLLQLRGLPALNGTHFAEKRTVVDFNEFSKTLLGLGYPEGYFCFGDSEGKGDLILLDDSVKYNPSAWTMATTVPFISVGKLLNVGQHKPIDIYVLEEPEITVVDAFYDGRTFTTVQQLSVETTHILQTLLEEHQLKGFYKIETCGHKILRIKPNFI